ncbi:hypothetical protein LO80_01505 [Candidatus Francisella endociliophora]|uniref:Uncharacterized protein n=1 Tax=Candidatus Francisella endociliophora TaxID=653937 RepID=A0A097EMJ2_9GAMM|nr:hypothetical protein [Francisella sp. FSC1006]AIT08780.1 hypothetical protein LO80_01505 [Francisella sp. FSC1006]
MTTKQKLKATYLLYILSIFFVPLMAVVLFIANKERKQQPKKWVKAHCNTLIKYTLLNFAWIFVTVLIVYLAGLIGGKTYSFFLIIGWLSMLWLWVFNLDQYFILVVAFFVERELGEPHYFREMKTLVKMIYTTLIDKFQRRKVKKL